MNDPHPRDSNAPGPSRLPSDPALEAMLDEALGSGAGEVISPQRLAALQGRIARQIGEVRASGRGPMGGADGPVAGRIGGGLRSIDGSAGSRDESAGWPMNRQAGAVASTRAWWSSPRLALAAVLTVCASLGAVLWAVMGTGGGDGRDPLAGLVQPDAPALTDRGDAMGSGAPGVDGSGSVAGVDPLEAAMAEAGVDRASLDRALAGEASVRGGAGTGEATDPALAELEAELAWLNDAAANGGVAAMGDPGSAAGFEVRMAELEARYVDLAAEADEARDGFEWAGVDAWLAEGEGYF